MHAKYSTSPSPLLLQVIQNLIWRFREWRTDTFTDPERVQSPSMAWRWFYLKYRGEK